MCKTLFQLDSTVLQPRLLIAYQWDTHTLRTGPSKHYKSLIVKPLQPTTVSLYLL